MFWVSAPHHRGGTSEKGHFFKPFCTFWTRVAITAPRRPTRTKFGSKAAWVLGNQQVAGFARRFGLLARQHVRCGAHMCPFQGQKSALGGAKQHASAATFHSLYSRANDALGLGLRVDREKSAKTHAVAKWSALRHKKRPRLAMRLSAPKAKKIARSATASGGACRAQPGARGRRKCCLRPANKTAFMSGKCLIFGFACGVHRVPVRRARPRSIDVEFDQPQPAHLRPSSTLHPGGANKHLRGPQRPAGARGANKTLNTRNGCFP